MQNIMISYLYNQTVSLFTLFYFKYKLKLFQHQKCFHVLFRQLYFYTQKCQRPVHAPVSGIYHKNKFSIYAMLLSFRYYFPLLNSIRSMLFHTFLYISKPIHMPIYFLLASKISSDVRLRPSSISRSSFLQSASIAYLYQFFWIFCNHLFIRLSPLWF